MTSNRTMAQQRLAHDDARKERGKSAPAARPRQRHRLLFTTTLVLVFLLTAIVHPLYGGPESALVVGDLDAKTETGAGFSHWVREWYTWFSTIESDLHPALGGPCDHNDDDDGHPFFLVNDNTVSGDRQCLVPAGRYFFVPIVFRGPIGDDKVEGDDCPTGCDQLIATATDPLDAPELLRASLDGLDLAQVIDLNDLRFSSDDCFVTHLPKSNFFGEQVERRGEKRCTFIGGYWLLVRPLEIGPHTLEVHANLRDGVTASTTYSLIVGPVVADAGPFVRGDCDGNGTVGGSPTEAVAVLNFAFRGADAPSCLAACDAEADGSITITDALRILRFSFLGLGEPDPPFPNCEASALATDVELGCEVANCVLE